MSKERDIENAPKVHGLGAGPEKCRVMIVGGHPSREAMARKRALEDHDGRVIKASAYNHGLELPGVYYTYAVKTLPRKKKPSAAEKKYFEPMLREEIKRREPDIVLCLGALAFQAVMGKKYKISQYRGVLLQHPDPELSETAVMGTHPCGPVWQSSNYQAEIANDWETVGNALDGVATPPGGCGWDVSSDADEIVSFCMNALSENGDIVVSLDCEWEGETWLSPGGYLRTIQIGTGIDYAFIVRLRDVDGNPAIADQARALAVLEYFLTHKRVKIVGHGIKEDAEWLLRYGIDILDNLEIDTMLAEHLLYTSEKYSLTELTEKHTNLGKYDIGLIKWKNANPEKVQYGYGAIPDDVIMPYAALDAIATYIIANKLRPLLYEDGYYEPRGKYPGLFPSVMECIKRLVEMETVGMELDCERVEELTRIYNRKLASVENQLKMAAAARGMEDFNYRSPDQVRALLFDEDKLNLRPVRTTDASNGVPWEIVADKMSQEEQEVVEPSTDKRTLNILQDDAEEVKLLKDCRSLGHSIAHWLADDYDPEMHTPKGKGGGLRGRLWADGRIHSNFSQTKTTGRLGSSHPNVQNFPKKAEGDIARIFGDEHPPDIRSCFKATDGYVLIETDWKQAELFVLGHLSGDSNMLRILSTPGLDMHDQTAIDAFDLQVLDQEGRPVPEQYILDMAARDEAAADEYKKTLMYRDQRGKVMDRHAFKSTIRIASKNLNFGIPYGRGAMDIAIQVKGETGTSKSVKEISSELEVMMDSWKYETYASAWAYMEKCGEAALSQGYLMNPWGRKRVFPSVASKALRAHLQRQGQNFPVQSTVADTCIIALNEFARVREERNLGFRIYNQVHDAIFLEVPIAEIDATKEVCEEVMAGIEIPMPRGPITLGVDIEVDDRMTS